jgi:hypothetical protein
MNRSVVTTIVFALIIKLPVLGQEVVKQEDYHDFKYGIYSKKSTANKFLKGQTKIIEPQCDFKNKGDNAFIKVENQEIALFGKINDKGSNEPIGILAKTSVTQVDTIFYKEINKETTGPDSLTFNVWYSITNNGKRYYTDYKIHGYIAFQKNLDNYD